MEPVLRKRGNLYLERHTPPQRQSHAHPRYRSRCSAISFVSPLHSPGSRAKSGPFPASVPPCLMPAIFALCSLPCAAKGRNTQSTLRTR